MRKILMVAYFFPPISSVGVFRTLKFAKYLPRFGWKPVILTVRNPDRYAVRGLDPYYAREKLSGVRVCRSFSIPLAWISKLGRLGINYKWFFLLPDVFTGWLPFAFSLGKKIVEKERIDVIYVSSPPVVGLIIGVFLAKATRKPLVIDYRDLWTGNPFISYSTKFHYRWEKKMEEMVLKNCDSIIIAGAHAKDELSRIFPFVKEKRVYVITNGYDPEDFSDVMPYKFSKFTILYAGTIYGQLQLAHFKMFLKALRYILQRGELPDFQIVLVGRSPPSIERSLTTLIQELDFTTKVHRLGEKSHREAIQLMLGADVLLLIPGSPRTITTKLFEYLATGKFIFNISDPKGEAALIINEENAGITVKADVLSVQESLSKTFDLKNYGIEENMDVRKKAINRFSRVELTKKLASIFDGVSKN